jgi:aminopeptidase YwaD
MKRALVPVAAMILAAAIPAITQEREDRTLLSWAQMRAIINEVSGERAMHVVLEATPYARIRTKAELEKGPYRETEVMARFAHEYGFSDVQIEMPDAPPAGGMGGGSVWSPTQAELWLVAPRGVEKLYDAFDVAVSVAANSESGDVTAELVDVGIGDRAEHYAGRDVADKVVLGNASPGALQRLGVFERGAVGVIGYYSSHGDQDIDQLGSSNVSANAPAGKKPGFGWSISTRLGQQLAKRLARGEKLSVRSIIKATTYTGRQEWVSARIPGDGSSTQAIVVTGHLYEGVTKQGANDDMSGCAVSLEFGRALIRLIADGQLPKPKRDIYFIWVPEISGSRAWLNKHADIKARLIADLNFDMEAIGLARSGSYWTMVRTPDTLPSFVNDVAESFMRAVAEINRERIHYRGTGYGPAMPVWAPRGSRDPFYISVDRYYGASDHVVFIGERIPAVMFITWPDLWYHTSEDAPDKLDSTQFKRVGVVGAASAATIAIADDTLALRIAAESLGNGTSRVGQAQKKGLTYLTDLTDAAGFAQAYKEARNAVRHQVGIEKETVRSAGILTANPAGADKRLASLVGALDQRSTALQAEVTAFAKLRAEQLKISFAEPAPSAIELKAARLLPEAVGGAQAGLGMGMGQRGGQQPGQPAPDPERAALFAAMRKIPGTMSGEILPLVAQKKTVLEIRDFISGEFEPVPLADVIAYFEAAQKLGIIKLTEKPEAPGKAAPRKK